MAKISERSALLAEIEILRKTADIYKVKYAKADYLTKKTNPELEAYINSIKNNLVNKMIREANKIK